MLFKQKRKQFYSLLNRIIKHLRFTISITSIRTMIYDQLIELKVSCIIPEEKFSQNSVQNFPKFLHKFYNFQKISQIFLYKLGNLKQTFKKVLREPIFLFYSFSCKFQNILKFFVLISKESLFKTRNLRHFSRNLRKNVNVKC